MALKTLGSTSTTILRALPAWSQVVAPADIAAIGQTISGDRAFATALSGYGPGATAVLAQGSTHTNATLDTLVPSAGAPLAQIRVGDIVIGAGGIPPGTFVKSVDSATAVTLSQAATASANSVYIGFVRVHAPMLGPNGILHLPGGRGNIILHPGDIVAIDNTGWPIVVSAAAISYAGSNWNLV